MNLNIAAMDIDRVSLIKYTLIVGSATYVLYKIVKAVRDFRAYAKIFNDCPGETDFHWLYGTIHKELTRHKKGAQFPGPNEAGLQYDIDTMNKRPRFSRAWAGPFVPVLLLYHPDLIRLVLKSSAPKPRGSIFLSEYDMGLGWLGEGLLISYGNKWARNRRLLTPAFHFDILKPYVTIKNEAGDILLDKIQKYAEDNESFEVFHLISLYLFDVLLQCAFSHTSHCQTTGAEDSYVQAVNELLSLWTKRALIPWQRIDILYKLTANGRKWRQLCDFVHSISDGLIAKRRVFLEENKDKLQKNTGKKHMLSLVDILLTAVDEDGKGMTPLEIRNEADTFLFEGFDTTTSALSWTLYSLARWPQHQVKVQEEVDALLKGRDSDYILWDDLTQLPYTTACIKEALRNYSTVPFIERMTEEELNIDGHKIPKGTFIACHLWCLHHNPVVWDRPHEYLPERFLEESAVGSDPFKFVPFSAGPRNCIGQNFAMHELKITVARIFHRFTLKLDPDHEVARTPLVTFKTEKGIKLFATPRKHEM